MLTILLSIKPEFAHRIMAGTKKFEYRKRIPREPVDRIIVYSTCPECKVLGEVIVRGVLSGSYSSIWEQTKKDAGISRSKYREDFKGSSRAFAYILDGATAYEYPKDLASLGIDRAPQSFRCFKDDSL